MTTLYTSVAPSSSPTQYSVLWRVDEGRPSCLTVDLIPGVQDPAIVSELAALHHLLLVKEVAGNNRNGCNLNLHCYHGAIKKLAQGRSSKRCLINYAQFLHSRFHNININVNKKELYFSKKSSNKIESITLDGPLEDIVIGQQIGKVNIRHHVVTRYMTRSGVLTYDRAWRKLNRILNSADLKQVSETHRKTHRNAVQYKNKSELWSYKDWLLRIVIDGDIKRLVTVFKKPQNIN